MPTIYLDNAATTPLREEVLDAMTPFLGEDWGNPSSVHRRGVAAREAIDRTRAKVARAVGAQPARVIFTSGGTEANNLAMRGLSWRGAQRQGAIWIGPTEHASIRACAVALAEEGFSIEHGQLDPSGSLDLNDCEERLSSETVLVSQMLVSNEFGSIYPVDCLAGLARAKAPEAAVHADAIQALGKLHLSLSQLGVDSLSLSAHKIGGPQGIGALVLARDLPLRPLVFGGGQERGLRSGTENVAAIVGFGRAVELAVEEQGAALESMKVLRKQLVEGLQKIGEIECLEPGDEEMQQPGILSLVVPGAPAEVWLHHLDSRGVVVSVGSACQANKKEISPVLLAAGLTAGQARQVLRVSLSGQTTSDEISTTLGVLGELVKELASL